MKLRTATNLQNNHTFLNVLLEVFERPSGQTKWKFPAQILFFPNGNINVNVSFQYTLGFNLSTGRLSLTFTFSSPLKWIPVWQHCFLQLSNIQKEAARPRRIQSLLHGCSRLVVSGSIRWDFLFSKKRFRFQMEWLLLLMLPGVVNKVNRLKSVHFIHNTGLRSGSLAEHPEEILYRGRWECWQPNYDRTSKIDIKLYLFALFRLNLTSYFSSCRRGVHGDVQTDALCSQVYCSVAMATQASVEWVEWDSGILDCFEDPKTCKI